MKSEEHRVTVAQYDAHSAHIGAVLAAKQPAYEHACNTLQKIPREGDYTVLFAVYPQHICAAGITAAMMAHVIMMQQIAEYYGKLDVAYYIA